MGIPRRPRSVRPQFGTALFFLTLFTLAAVGACTDILGIHDRTLTGSGGSGVTTGGGGAGGATGGGGTGGAKNECADDADCVTSKYGQHCDTVGKKCVECLPGLNDDCAVGLYCDTSMSCAIGCAEKADCNPGAEGPLSCDPTTHECQGCGVNAPCPPGSKCNTDTGACVPGCDTTADCPTSDWACCNLQCKNVSKDVLNCGACEDPCVPSDSTTWLCLDSGCVFQACQNGWGNCDMDQSKGNGCETNTQTSPTNCGGCGIKCNLAHATAGCSVGNCTIQSCDPGFANCDGLTDNGCETNTNTTVTSCGACGQSCDMQIPHANTACDGGTCGLVSCKTGFSNCDGMDLNGCETNTSNDVQHCGTCDTACALAHATSGCAAGACAVDSCDSGFGNCDNNPANGCEANFATDPNHCGSCAPCSFANANATCSAGTCAMGTCKPGFADCNNDPDDGCEVDLKTSATSCGACGHLCASNVNSAGMCVNGACQFTCSNGYKNCDNLDANGCETNTANDVANCGTCAHVCGGAGTPYCVNGTCGSSNCAPNTANCDGDPGMSCETDLTGTQNCGFCGHVCSQSNGAASCNGSTCSIACNSGYANCNNNVADGCEQPLNVNDNCGACGAACTRPHAVTGCATGACLIISCASGWADCNNNQSDGCETNINNSNANCGGCGVACNPDNATGSCVAGACTIGTCDNGFGNCNGSVDDGCEVPTGSDPAHCGSCQTQCSYPHATAVCNGGTCGIGGCLSPWGDCDNNEANGCESNTDTNIANCGSCGNACSDVNATAMCSAGMCSLMCTTGFKNCNNFPGDGCETSIQTIQDCGDCSNLCDLPNASESCNTGSCTLSVCEPGFFNCDLQAFNGCECAASCVGLACGGGGTCGDLVCSGGETCAGCPVDCCMGSGGSGGSTTGSGGMGGTDGGVGGIIMDGGGGLPDGGGNCGLHPGVACDMTTCTILGQGCCFGMGSPGCSFPQSCMPPTGTFYACDDKSDCPGALCCYTPAMGASCNGIGMCSGVGELELCTTPTPGVASCECTGNQQCCDKSMKSPSYPSCQPLGMVCK